MRRMFIALAATSVASLGLVAAGCGDDNNDNEKSTPAATATSSKAPASSETGSSTLRAGLTGLLEDHVYLAGIAVSTGLGKGLDSGEFKASAGALDKNSVALSKAIGGVYGDAAGKQFLALWRKHIGFFVDYAAGKATKDQAKVDKALKDLDGYRADFGAFISSANPNLPKQAVADELKPHIETLAAAIDAAAAGSTSVYDKLQKAAAHMPMTAAVLAGGISKQYPDKFSGSADAGGSELRSGLTAQLTDHVYLAALAVNAAVSAKDNVKSAGFKAAAKTLDDNSVALSNSIASVYGEDAGKQFLALWRKHIGFFVNYTLGKATKNNDQATKALADLDGYRNDFGAFISSANPNLPKQAVADELKPHIESLTAAIRAAVSGSPKVYDRIAEAASHMPMTAQVLAGGITKQFPDKFPAS